MNTMNKIILVLILAALHSCTYSSYLRTQPARPDEIDGTYTLIFHGGNYLYDVKNAVILDKEGDPYTFDIIASEYDYTVKRGVPAKEALTAAERHVKMHPAVNRYFLNRIISPDGKTAGYEFRPFYSVAEMGYSDVIYTSYTFRDNKVIVNIWVRQEVEDRDRRDPRDGEK